MRFQYKFNRRSHYLNSICIHVLPIPIVRDWLPYWLYNGKCKYLTSFSVICKPDYWWNAPIFRLQSKVIDEFGEPIRIRSHWCVFSHSVARDFWSLDGCVVAGIRISCKFLMKQRFLIINSMGVCMELEFGFWNFSHSELLLPFGLAWDRRSRHAINPICQILSLKLWATELIYIDISLYFDSCISFSLLYALGSRDIHSLY